MKLFKHAFILALAISSFSVIATPIFTIAPLNVPSIVIAGQTATLSYQVTANASAMRNQPNGVLLNTFSPAVASLLTPTIGDCAISETFSTSTTCTVQLTIDATHLAVGQVISGRPIFCNHPELASPMYCSQPAAPVSIKVVSADDPSVYAVTVTPTTVSLYPGESQILTVTNTSGDHVTTISATTDATSDFTVADHCTGTTLLQGQQCTVVLNPTTTPTISAPDAPDILTIEANDYEAINVNVYIRPVTVIAGSYITQVNATKAIFFEGLIWNKKTNWAKSLPTSLAATPVIFFSVANDPKNINDWLVVGTTHNGAPTPIPPRPPYVYNQRPVIVESTDSAQTWNQVTPNPTPALPENSTFMDSNINNGVTLLVGFDGTLTYDPSASPAISGDFVPLIVTRQNNSWMNETVNFSPKGEAGALMSVTSSEAGSYAAGIEIIPFFGYPIPHATIWQRETDTTHPGTYIWSSLIYYANQTGIPSAINGIFLGTHANANTLVAVGSDLDLSETKTTPLIPLLVVGNTGMDQTWTWAQPTLPSVPTLPGKTISELSSVSANPMPASSGDAYWVTVGYSATMTTVNKITKLTNAIPLLWFNASKNATDTNWTAVDLSGLVPPNERWQLSSVYWNGYEWMAVGTRDVTGSSVAFPLQPLIITSLDGITWTEVATGLPKHALTELAPLIFGVS